jgi:hypothetical protein
MRARWLFSALLLAACGGSDGGSISADGDDAAPPDAGGGIVPPNNQDDGGAGVDGTAPHDAAAEGAAQDAAPDAAFTEATHPPLPKLVRGSASGGLLTAPVVVPIFFAGYDHANDVKAQLQAMGTVGTYWKDAVSEYGIGAYTYGTPVDLTESAPARVGQADIVNFLRGKLDGTHPEFGTPTNETIYVVYYPSTTAITGSCSDPQTGGIGYGGYHDSLKAGNGVTVAYGVIAECASFGSSITNALDMVTVAGSHEIIEATTDTVPGAGYASIDQNGFALDIFLQGNEENGDLCAVNHAFYRPGNGYPYLLSRGWSNKSAAAGLDPCQPALPAQPYIAAAPVMPDTITAEGSTGPGVKIPVGSSKTIDVELWSTGPTPPFTVGAKQAIGVTQLGFAWDKTTGVNGDKLKLTITVNTKGSRGYEAFVVTANLDGQATPVWAGVVTN